jgi:hypothetical protein
VDGEEVHVGGEKKRRREGKKEEKRRRREVKKGEEKEIGEERTKSFEKIKGMFFYCNFFPPV